MWFWRLKILNNCTINDVSNRENCRKNLRVTNQRAVRRYSIYLIIVDSQKLLGSGLPAWFGFDRCLILDAKLRSLRVEYQ